MSGGRVHTALVVDDHADTRAVFRQILEMYDFQVTEAENGMKALGILDAFTFDVMMLDLSMPQIEGEEILMDTYRQRSHDNMTIIATTAYPERFTPEVMRVADHFLEKPVVIEKMQEIIRQLQGASAVV